MPDSRSGRAGVPPGEQSAVLIKAAFASGQCQFGSGVLLAAYGRSGAETAIILTCLHVVTRQIERHAVNLDAEVAERIQAWPAGVGYTDGASVSVTVDSTRLRQLPEDLNDLALLADEGNLLTADDRCVSGLAPPAVADEEITISGYPLGADGLDPAFAMSIVRPSSRRREVENPNATDRWYSLKEPYEEGTSGSPAFLRDRFLGIYTGRTLSDPRYKFARGRVLGRKIVSELLTLAGLSLERPDSPPPQLPLELDELTVDDVVTQLNPLGAARESFRIGLMIGLAVSEDVFGHNARLHQRLSDSNFAQDAAGFEGFVNRKIGLSERAIRGFYSVFFKASNHNTESWIAPALGKLVTEDVVSQVIACGAFEANLSTDDGASRVFNRLHDYDAPEREAEFREASLLWEATDLLWSLPFNWRGSAPRRRERWLDLCGQLGTLDALVVAGWSRFNRPIDEIVSATRPDDTSRLPISIYLLGESTHTADGVQSVESNRLPIAVLEDFCEKMLAARGLTEPLSQISKPIWTNAHHVEHSIRRFVDGLEI